jgi:hypothetical protein
MVFLISFSHLLNLNFGSFFFGDNFECSSIHLYRRSYGLKMKKHFDKNQPEPRDKQHQNKSMKAWCVPSYGGSLELLKVDIVAFKKSIFCNYAEIVAFLDFRT